MLIYLIMKIILYFFLLLFPMSGFAQSFFAEPQMTFIHQPTESIYELRFNSSEASIESIQSEIDQIRTSFPTSIVRVSLAGIYTVTSSALQIGDKVVLILDNATIQAAPSATASSLPSVAPLSSCLF